MSKFSTKRKKGIPVITTASLPDIIFMLLFFFMVVTVMRETSLKLKIELPQATELTKLQNKSLVNEIYIGKPINYGFDHRTRIQLNDHFASTKDIGNFIAISINNVPEYLVLERKLSNFIK